MIDALRAIREDAGVSQRELARRLGKPPSFTNKIELVERRLDLLEFIAIAEALGLSAAEALATIRASLPEIIAL